MNKKIEQIKDDIRNYILNKKKIEDEWIEDQYPIDIAEALSEMKEDKVEDITEMLDNENLAEIIEQSEENMQVNILKTKSYDDIIDIFSYMPTDVITDILGNLPVNMSKNLLNQSSARGGACHELRLL